MITLPIGFFQGNVVTPPSGMFTIGTGFAGLARAMAFQTGDSKLVIGGNFTSYNGTLRNRIVRLFSGGTVDTSFTIGTGFNSDVYAIAIQSDGKIVVGGNFITFNGISRPRIARLNSDGSLDNTFVVGTGFNAIVYTLAIQSDGKILVGGTFINYNGTAQSGITRLNTDGTFDTTWNTGGTGFYSSQTVRGISIQPSDGKIICVGLMGAYDAISGDSGVRKIARLHPNGNFDTSFPTVPFGFNTGTNIVYQTAFQSTNRLITVGDFSSYKSAGRVGVVRINQTNANNDNTFNVGFGGFGTPISFSNTPTGCLVQPDDKIVVYGLFNSFDGVTVSGVVRLLANGLIDATFNTGGAGFSVGKQVLSGVLLPDGKIVLGGSFTTYNGLPRNNIVRLNSDGSDNTQ
ncbi:MAG: delta-60 repeat domain-containing protein [Richelia sp. RM2_1_2]|nr:delta-60 repeat domain-containing protein [Richelia sp. RM2_1_2]